MTKPIGPDLFRHLTSVGDPTVSPDGSRCAYLLSWIDETSSESRSRIYQVRLVDDGDESTPQPFTRGNADTHPRYSPDGAYLAFLRADDPPETRRQVWLIPADGGEASRLTDLPSGAREFAWSPDSSRLVVVADVFPDHAGDADSPENRPPESQPKEKSVRRIRYRHDAIGWRGDNHFHLFLVNVRAGDTTQITDGDWDDMAPAWSPDGNRIAFISGRSGSRDVTATSEVYVLDLDDDEEMDYPELWSQGLTDAAAVSWSPDGRRLLAVGGEGEGLMVLWQAYLYILEENQPPRRLTDDGIRPCLGYPGIYPPLDLRWTKGKDGSGDQVIFLADSFGETRLYALDVPGGDDFPQPVALTGGGELLSGIAMDSRASRVVLSASGPADPSDLHLVQPGGHRRRITDHNALWLAGHPPAPIEKFIVETDDYDIECRLYHPPDFDPAVKYPLVLEIHGRPQRRVLRFFRALAPGSRRRRLFDPRGESSRIVHLRGGVRQRRTGRLGRRRLPRPYNRPGRGLPT